MKRFARLGSGLRYDTAIRLKPTRPNISSHLNANRILRYASTVQQTTAPDSSLLRRIRNLVYGITLFTGLGFGYFYVTDTRSATVHQYLIPSLLRLLVDDAEDAHETGTRALRIFNTLGLAPRERPIQGGAGDLRVNVWDTILDNPIAVSAGLDKKVRLYDEIFTPRWSTET